jgi:hypothetical protein
MKKHHALARKDKMTETSQPRKDMKLDLAPGLHQMQLQTLFIYFW